MFSLTGCGLFDGEPDLAPGRFRATLSGDLEAVSSGGVTVAPVHFTQVLYPPQTQVTRGFTLTSDSLASESVRIYAYTTVVDDGGPSAQEIPEGTFRIGPVGSALGPVGGVIVSADGERLSLREGTLTLRRVGETVEGTVRASGSVQTISGRVVSARVTAEFVAVPGPSAP